MGGSKVERIDLSFKVKSVDDQGVFFGMAASYNTVDLGGDLIEPGAFARTIANGKKFPLLWQHNVGDPIGSCEVQDSSQGLQVTGRLLLDDAMGMKAYRLLKEQVIRGLSIGYDCIRDSIEDGVRHLKELRLWEISVVTFPMNELATVTGVKAVSDDDRAKHLKAIDEHRKAIDRHQRGISAHLKELLDGFEDETDDPALLENDEGDDEPDEGSKALLVELQRLAEQATALAHS
jgi:HK97 family phage prohead protease